MVPQTLRVSFFFLLKSIFFLLLRLVTSIVFASSFSVPSFLLIIPITFFILLLYLWLLKFSLGSSLVVVVMIFFIISDMFIIAYQSIFILSVLKSLSDNFNRWTFQYWCLLIPSYILTYIYYSLPHCQSDLYTKDKPICAFPVSSRKFCSKLFFCCVTGILQWLGSRASVSDRPRFKLPSYQLWDFGYIQLFSLSCLIWNGIWVCILQNLWGRGRRGMARVNKMMFLWWVQIVPQYLRSENIQTKSYYCQK